MGEVSSVERKVKCADVRAGGDSKNRQNSRPHYRTHEHLWWWRALGADAQQIEPL